MGEKQNAGVAHEEELEALRHTALVAGELAVTPDIREPRGIYDREDVVMFRKARAGRWICRVFGHREMAEPLLNFEQETVGTGVWCKRCLDVLEKERATTHEGNE